MKIECALLHGLMASVAAVALTTAPASAQEQKRPNIVMLMTDDTGWNDFRRLYGGRRRARPSGEDFMGARADIAGDPSNPDLNIAWKYLWTAKDTWLGSEQNLGATGAVYNLTMDPFEKYDMLFNGAVSSRLAGPSPGKWAGQDNGWAAALIVPVVMEFNKSIVDFPSIKRVPGGASTDWRPNLQRPDNPLPLIDMKRPPQVKASGVD
jgi:hypothetical protein